MAEINIEELIRAVTQQVLSSLEGAGPEAPCVREGSRRILTIGRGGNVSEKVCPDASFLEIEDYEAHQDILRYDGVLIRSLTLNQLVDLAQGRAPDPSCCAVVQALLQNVDIQMLETALPHRKYASKIRTPFYQKLENDVKQLQMYGIRLVKQAGNARGTNVPLIKSPSYTCHEDRLITEDVAMQMVQDATAGEIHLGAGTILTPSAKDVFARAKVRILKDR